MSRAPSNPLIFPFFILGLSVAIVAWISAAVNIWIFVRFVIFVAVCIALIAASVLISILGPSKFVYRSEDWDDATQYYHPPFDPEKWNVLLDTHVHTRYSDGRLSVEDVVKYHIAVGFNACVITDHNTVANVAEILALQEKYADQIVVIPGVEYTTERIHICFLGIRDWHCEAIPKHPTDEELAAAIAEVHRLGGVVAVCHYPWSTGGSHPRIRDHPTREQVTEWGADLIECANWDDDISLTDFESYEFCQTHPTISPCAGTDMHDPRKDPLSGWTVLQAAEFTEEGILAELRTHRTDMVFPPAPIPYPIRHAINWKYHALRPFYMLGDMFKSLHQGGPVSNLDGRGFAMWIIYIVLAFALLELLRFLGAFCP